MGRGSNRYLLALAAVILLSSCGCAGALHRGPQSGLLDGAEKERGIRVEGIRLTAGGYMLDFRFRVEDAGLAEPFVNRKYRPYLMDEATGAKFLVPAPTKVGSLRQTANNAPARAGQIYFVLFANPGRAVKKGAVVTVAIGGQTIPGLVVE